MKRLATQAVVLALAISVLPGALADADEAPRAPFSDGGIWALEVDLGFSAPPMPCGKECVDDCEFLYHEGKSTPGDFEAIASHTDVHSCVSVMGQGDCDPVHENCNVGFAVNGTTVTLTNQEIMTRLATATSSELLTLLTDWSPVLSINVERGALQVAGCDGQLIASLPLTGELVEAWLEQ
jgi:hypothetical protein